MLPSSEGCNFTWSARQLQHVWEDCTSSWPFGKLSLAGKENSGVTRWWLKFNYWPKGPSVVLYCESQSPHIFERRWQRLMQIKRKSYNGWLLQLKALLIHSKHTIHPSLCSSTPTDMLCLPPSCHTTHKQGENQNPHKKSRWEYIIWSEKQFVLAIYCLCAKVISLSSSISAGSSYWVGGGHYTTWLQNLHRPLQRPGSLSARDPRWGRLCQIMFWLRLDDNNIPGFMMAPWACTSYRTCIYAKAEVELYLLWTSICMFKRMLSPVQQQQHTSDLGFVQTECILTQSITLKLQGA